MSDINSSRTMEIRTLTSRVAEGVSVEAREIELMIAPYGEVADAFPEMYDSGAFGDPGAVPLKLETSPGHGGPVVGRSVEFRDTDAGLIGVFRISETRDGDDALTLAADGALGASAGFMINDRDIVEGRSIIRSGDLHEVTLTGTPAYAGAAVIDVRSKGVLPMTDTVETPAESGDTTEARGAYMTRDEASDLVTRAIDEFRRDASDETPPAVEVVAHRGHEYRSFGELLSDVITHARRQDPAASERLTRSIDDGLVRADGTAVELRAHTNVGTSGSGSGGGLAPNAYVPDLLELLREGRPTANLFASRQLPDIGNNVDLPRVTTGATVGYQATQGASVSNTAVATDRPSFPKSTMAGGQGVSLQAAQWTNPSYLDEVVRDHIAAYSEFLDAETIVGDGATPNATAYTGILTAGTDVPIGGTGTIADLIGKIGTAWASVYQGSRRAPIAFVMNSKTWGLLLDEVDSDGRPIIVTDSPSNPQGLGNAGVVGGTLRSVPVVIDENVPSNLGTGTDESPVILGSFRDALLFENQGAPAQVALTYPDVLVTDVTVYGFSALAIRRGGSFAVMSGLVTG